MLYKQNHLNVFLVVEKIIMFNKILITGATGFIGRHLIKTLSNNKDIKNIRILARKTSDEKLLSNFKDIIENLEIYFGDLSNPEDINQAIKDCDAVINLAAKVTYRNDPDLHNINVNGLKNLCEAAIDCNIKKFVQVSSIASLGFTTDVNFPLDETAAFDLKNKGYYYAESKYDADVIALDYFQNKNLPVVICLPAEVYGEDGWETAKNLVDLIKTPMVWKGGTSVVYVDDVVTGILNSLTMGRNGEKYILGGENLTIEEITKTILSIANKNKKITKLPNFIINHPVKYISILMEKFNLEPIFDSSVIKYATKYWFVDSSKAKREINFNPLPPEIIFSKTIKWLEDENAI